MRLFPPPFEVTLDEGFTAERDLFGRAPIAESLTHLMGNLDQPIVLGLDGDWGSGKTTFLRFWTGELRKTGFPVVFFDAFQNDYADDAFIALAGEVFALIEENKKDSSKIAKKFASKATDAGKVLLRSGMKLGIKAATLGALNSTDLSELAEAISEESAEAFDVNIGEMITQQRAHRNAIDEFKAALSELPSLLAKPPEGQEQKPLIFIIDELDRCRPAFALALLERVKHFFSVPNLHFVLGMNSGQLENSVKAVYGPGIDARTYLQKFIHLTWTLSQRERYASDRARGKYVRFLNQTMKFTGNDTQVANKIFSFVEAIAEHRELSFRTIERIIAVAALALATTSENKLRIAPLIGGLSIMKVIDPSLFIKAKEGRLTWANTNDFFKFDELEKNKEIDLDWAKNWWQYGTDLHCPYDIQSLFSQSTFRYGFDDGKSILSYTADTVIDNALLK